MSLTTLEVLIAARELIADEKRWCVGQSALKADGFPCQSQDPEAVRWCAIGAPRKFCGRSEEGDRLWFEVVDALRSVSGESSPAFDVNDRQGHAATLAMFDRAISASRAKAKEAGT